MELMKKIKRLRLGKLLADIPADVADELLELNISDIRAVISNYDFLFHHRKRVKTDYRGEYNFLFSILYVRSVLLTGVLSDEMRQFLKDYEFLKDQESLEKLLWFVNDKTSDDNEEFADELAEQAKEQVTKTIRDDGSIHLVIHSPDAMRYWGKDTEWAVSRLYHPIWEGPYEMIIEDGKRYLKLENWVDERGIVRNEISSTYQP